MQVQAGGLPVLAEPVELRGGHHQPEQVDVVHEEHPAGDDREGRRFLFQVAREQREERQDEMADHQQHPHRLPCAPRAHQEPVVATLDNNTT